jgi:hypothetical protein
LTEKLTQTVLSDEELTNKVKWIFLEVVIKTFTW